MKKSLLKLFTCQLLIVSTLALSAQSLVPFDSCPGVSVAITRPGFNNNMVPFQIYLIDDSTGAVQASGSPIDLQINGFGLNNKDGFLYGIHESFNVADPWLARVDKNGQYENVGRIVVPNLGPFKVGIINTAAGTMDDDDNYYFTAILINLQNIMLPPELYVGKIERISHLNESNNALPVQYKKIDPGTCSDELLPVLLNPLTGALQDIAFNPADRNIYSYIPGVTGGKLARFNPGDSNPVLNCVNPPQPNIVTTDLSGLFFGRDSLLYILTIDGNYYGANTSTGVVTHIAQTTLPLSNGNLRGDMASCVGRTNPASFNGCPGLALAITRPGFNNTGGPSHIYTINPATGETRAVGNDINLQINAFGLNNKDGFLYAMHETADIFGPTFSRIDSNGVHVDLGTLTPPPSNGNRVGIINTAAATMDGFDNYYFTAVVADTMQPLSIPRLYLGTIKHVSKIEAGDPIHIKYQRVYIGTCFNEILQVLSNPSNGILQDLALNPADGRIYTYIQTGTSPAPGKLAYLKKVGNAYLLNCINTATPNVATQDLSGMHADGSGNIYLMTIDGKYYKASPWNGSITEIAQTSLPLLNNNLRGDMASCVPKNKFGHNHDDDDRAFDPGGDEIFETGTQSAMSIAPNPVNGDQLSLFVHSTEATTAELRIINANGTLVQRQKISLNRGENQFKIQLAAGAKGVFAAVLVFPAGRTSTSKFIKM